MSVIANRDQDKAWNEEGIRWAAHPERYNGMLEAFNAPLFAAAGIAPEHRVLDVGCGTGLTTLLAARQAHRGQATGIDLSVPMLERARADAAEQGIANVSFERGDAQVHPLPEHGFDVVISRGGVMFFADLAAAFSHLRQALAPTGRLAFVCPQPGRPDSPYARATAALSPYLRAPSPASRGMATLYDPADIKEVLTTAGYADIAIAPIDACMNLGADVSAAVDFIFDMGPTVHNLGSVDTATVTRIRAEVGAGLAEFAGAGGVLVPGGVWCVSASSGHGATNP
ncbi:class I SAM-dependent methyltransferase [Streptodolium elevatio]